MVAWGGKQEEQRPEPTLCHSGRGGRVGLHAWLRRFESEGGEHRRGSRWGSSLVFGSGMEN